MKVVAKRFVNCKSGGWELGVTCFQKGISEVVATHKHVFEGFEFA
jgi:hypothetical protein